MKKYFGVIILLSSILLAGCLKLNLGGGDSDSDSQIDRAKYTKRSTTIQFTHSSLADVKRVVQNFAFQSKMVAVPSNEKLVGSGWTQESYRLNYTTGTIIKDKHHILLVLLFRNGQATVQLKPSNASHQEYPDLERSLVDVLRAHFGASNVVKVSD